MSSLVGVFPALVVLVTLGLLGMLVRLDRRLSRGSLSPGPREPVRPEPPGLLPTPWELQAIDEQLRGRPGDRHRTDLVKTVNRLIGSAGIRDPAARLPFDATDHEIQNVVAELERRLELPPDRSGPPELGPSPSVPGDPGLGSGGR